jgi:hypothetical protein
MGRPKKATRELLTLEDAQAAMYRLLLATCAREKQEAGRNLAVAAAQKKFEADIDELIAQQADCEAQLERYYMVNVAGIEKDGARSLQLTYGVIGRRLSPPALKLLNKAWTWATVKTKLRAVYHATYFSTPAEPEIDKEKLKKELGQDENRLRDCGLKLHADEKFFAEVQRP